MKLAEHNNSLETNATFNRQAFEIGNASIIIGMLRKSMYGKPIRTLVQEYICNARDAHREINSTDNILITIPNRLNPVFKVRDFGPGISPDRMTNVFRKFGESTKRADNSQTGGFGIGAKSAWSYTDSFTIVTFIDGLKRTYICHTGNTNTGDLDQVGTAVATTEKNGTEIQIAVKRDDLDNFKNAAFRATYFWQSGYDFSGITRAEYPEKCKTVKVIDGLEIASGYLPRYITNDRYNYSDTPIAVVDGIVYPLGLSNEALSDLKRLLKGTPIFFIETGVIELAANREAIMEGDSSQAAITKMATGFQNDVVNYLKKEFAKATDIKSYIDIHNNLSNSIKTDKYSKFGDYTLGGRYDNRGNLLNPNFQKLKIDVATSTKNNSIRKKDLFHNSYNRDTVGVPYDQVNRFYFTDGSESTIKINNRLRTAFASGANTIYLFSDNGNTKEFNKIVKELQIQDLKTLTLTEKPKTPKAAKIIRSKKEFCVRVLSKYDNKTPKYLTLDGNTDKWLYIPMVKADLVGYKTWDVKQLAPYLQTLGYRICGLSSSAQKHVANDPNFSLLKDWLATYKPTKKCIESVKYSLRKNNDHANLLKQIPNMNDKILNQAIEEYKNMNSDKLPEILFKVAKKESEVTRFLKFDVALRDILKETYPLLNEFSYRRTVKIGAELTHYVNAKFKESKKLTLTKKGA